MLKILLLFVLLLGGCATKQPQFSGGAVAADHFLASLAGSWILEEGGNAVDAAVATSFTLSVVRPFSCGIGGGGFMLIQPPNSQPIALNYRETAPSEVGALFYSNHNSRIGPDATGVPGTVAGLLAAHEKYGTLPLAKVMKPAIEIARSGFYLDAAYKNGVENARRSLGKVTTALQESAKALHRFGIVGELTLQGQAQVLEAIAKHGRAAFYEGDVASAIVASTKGHISLDDLKAYTPRWEEPLVVDVGGGFTIVAMPPPSSGGIALIQILSLMQRLGATELNRMNPLYSHLLVESMKHAFADRAEHLADASFVDVPIDALIDPLYLDELASRVSNEVTAESTSYGSNFQLPDDAGTSHLCVVDRGGMVVSVTETINTSFGSQVLVEPYDFVLNNEMDDFSPPTGTNVYGLRQSDKNLPQPGKQPLSSMSPTIVLHDGKPIFVVGASGGPRIISGVVQVILNHIWFDDEPINAIKRPRLHHQWIPDKVYFEKSWRDNRTVHSLQNKGHETTTRHTVGVVQGIAIEDGILKPASDPRKGGSAMGVN